MEKCTFIDGIASSQALDTSGEVVDLKGLDISSLLGAAINWEHERKLPDQIVGKITEVKKIFGKEDCENPRHMYYWEKIKLPFLYIKARLFDDKKPSSKEVAALFLDDAEHPTEDDMLGFSVEGAKIEKVGAVITRSIARLVTLAHMPANKTCVSEMVPDKQAPIDPSDISELFKGEMRLFQFEPTYVQLLEKKEEEMEKGMNGDWQKEGYTIHHSQAANGTHHIEAKDKSGNHVGAAELHPSHDSKTNTHFLHPGQVYTEDAHQRKGIASAMYKLGESKSGMKIHPSHKQTEVGKQFSQNRKSEQFEKKETLKKDVGTGGGAFIGSSLAMAEGETLEKAAPSVPGWSKPHVQKTGDKKMAAGVHFWHPVHGSVSVKKTGVGNFEVHHNNKVVGVSPDPGKAAENAHKHMKGFVDKMEKALTAGSMNAAPSQLAGGAALGKESLDGKMKKKEKSKWYDRASEAYKGWDKREVFRKFMKERMPHIADGEVDAIGRVLALKKDHQAEQNLSKMYSSYTKKPKD